jgi:hypothetical protein
MSRSEMQPPGRAAPQEAPAPSRRPVFASAIACGARIGARARPTGVAVFGALLLGLVPLAGVVGPARAAPWPASAVTRPDEPGPIFVVGAVSVGGTLHYDFFKQGCGASLIFRPNAAADFYRPLYDWNTALVLEGHLRRVSVDRRNLTVGAVLRRYLRDMRGHGPAESPFLGAGVGGGEITYPAGGDAGADSTGAAAASGTASGKQTAFTYLFEAGYELSPTAGTVFVIKAQWQIWRHGGRDYSGWALHLGAGIPVPW